MLLAPTVNLPSLPAVKVSPVLPVISPLMRDAEVRVLIDWTSASGAALAGPTSAITPSTSDLLRLSGHGIKIAPRTYYVFRSRTVLASARSDAGLVSQFAMVHGDNCGAYGARKVSMPSEN